MGLAVPTAFAALELGITGHVRDHGWNDEQIDALAANAWMVDGLTQMYGFGDDPLSEPGVSEEQAAGTIPLAIGVEYVRFTDERHLPPAISSTTVMPDGKVVIPYGEGPMEINVDYAWVWAEFKGDIDYLRPGAGYNIAWPLKVRDATAWSSAFTGDSWTGGSHIPFFYNDPSQSDPTLAWTAGVSIANDSGGLDAYDGPGGVAWFHGNLAGMYVPADLFMQTAGQHIEAYGLSADYTEGAGFQFDPNAPRMVTVVPGNFTADGRQGGLEPLDQTGRFRINVGFEPYSDIINGRLIRDAEDQVWAALTPLRGWPTEDPTGHFVDAFFSLGVVSGISYGDMSGPLVINEFHDGAHNTFGFNNSVEFIPSLGYVLNDGSLRIRLDYSYSQLESDTDKVTLYTSGAFWRDGSDEDGRQQVDAEWELDVSMIPMLDFGMPGGLFVAYDLFNDEQVPPPDAGSDPVSEEPTDDLGLAELDEPIADLGIVLEVELGDTWDGWGWGLAGLLTVALIGPIFLWFKPLDWWTCWLPWFIGIFVWVPFLLACLWWGRPSWWWVPLLAWYPIVGGYTWYWARDRDWWEDEYLYYSGGYLGVLAVATIAVGSPEWGLLLPLYWVPWVGFYVWARGRHQPWWEPWMWAGTAIYVGWNFVWVAALTPWWAWWLPVATAGFVGWWFPRRGYEWSALWLEPKWCWTIPFVSLPFLLWWIPVWGGWWLIVLLLLLVLLVVSLDYQRRREDW